MRLIDADTIPWEGFPNDFGEYHEDYVEQRVVDKMPTIDAVEVVRCKDCEHWREEDDIGYCENPYGLDNYARPYDFCSYGERKANDNGHRKAKG